MGKQYFLINNIGRTLPMIQNVRKHFFLLDAQNKIGGDEQWQKNEKQHLEK